MSAAARSESAGTGHTRHPDDFYATEAWVTRSILPHLDLTGSILEPSAGDGAIVRVLLEAGVPAERLRAVEIDASRAAQVPCLTQCEDFLKLRVIHHDGWQPDLIIGNPPFSLAMEFVEHALSLAKKDDGERGTVCFLLRLAFVESAKRAAFHRAYPADLFVLPTRPSFTPDGKTDSAAYAWFRWSQTSAGRWSILPDAPAKAGRRGR